MCLLDGNIPGQSAYLQSGFLSWLRSTMQSFFVAFFGILLWATHISFHSLLSRKQKKMHWSVENVVFYSCNSNNHIHGYVRKMNHFFSSYISRRISLFPLFSCFNSIHGTDKAWNQIILNRTLCALYFVLNWNSKLIVAFGYFAKRIPCWLCINYITFK